MNADLTEAYEKLMEAEKQVKAGQVSDAQSGLDKLRQQIASILKNADETR
ncbi:MAG: hypothetical protein IJD01_05730 [Clostridia bacterium]|nr:hypothetical protein [Clostridia bacterium]